MTRCPWRKHALSAGFAPLLVTLPHDNDNYTDDPKHIVTIMILSVCRCVLDSIAVPVLTPSLMQAQYSYMEIIHDAYPFQHRSPLEHQSPKQYAGPIILQNDACAKTRCMRSDSQPCPIIMHALLPGIAAFFIVVFIAIPFFVAAGFCIKKVGFIVNLLSWAEVVDTEHDRMAATLHKCHFIV
jgi:hypothetical protein